MLEYFISSQSEGIRAIVPDYSRCCGVAYLANERLLDGGALVLVPRPAAVGADQVVPLAVEARVASALGRHPRSQTRLSQTFQEH